MILMEHNRDFAVPRTEYYLNVKADQRAQTVIGTHDTAHGSDDQFLRDLHGMIHDLEQNFVLALKVVIEPALAEFERGGNVVHRRGVVSPLLEQAGGGAQDFLP